MVSSFVDLVIRLVLVLFKFSYCVHKHYLFAKSMCPHASGVVPLGAREFFTHFGCPLGPQCQFRVRLGISLG